MSSTAKMGGGGEAAGMGGGMAAETAATEEEGEPAVADASTGVPSTGASTGVVVLSAILVVEEVEV